MPKKKKKTGIKGWLSSNSKLASLLVVVIGIAAVGSYFVVISHADYEPGDAAIGVNLRFNPNSDDATDVAPGGTSTVTLEFTSNQYGYPADSFYPTPVQQHVLVLSYDTKLFRLSSGSCTSPYGCYATSYDPRTARDAHITNQMHKQKILICFNIPANFNERAVPVYRFTFQRTSNMPADQQRTDGNWLITRTVHVDRNCQSGPPGAGVGTDSVEGGCNDPVAPYNACDNGDDPGAAGRIGLTGTGSGGSGTGTGNSGTGTGQTGKGKGGGSSGATATTQANQPNPVPSSSAQGADKKQPAIEPSPFFDGKEYKPGSDVDNLIFGTTKVGGLKVVNIWIYILTLLLVAGGLAAYFLWWRPKHRKPTQTKRLPKKS